MELTSRITQAKQKPFRTGRTGGRCSHGSLLGRSDRGAGAEVLQHRDRIGWGRPGPSDAVDRGGSRWIAVDRGTMQLDRAR